MAWGVVAVVACGNLTSSPHDVADASPGGDSSDAQAGDTHRAGTASGGANSASGSSSSSGGRTLVTPSAGTTSSNTPEHVGSGGEGGQPDYPAANLCIYPEDIPQNWGAGGEGGQGGAATMEMDESGCVVGTLGEFDFMGCRYQLLAPGAFNVDVFIGGHSHCCYSARVLTCP